MKHRPRCTPGAPVLTGLALLLATFATPSIAVEPLTLRVADAIGAPGETTAIIFRTYATRPVRRGRLANGGGALTAKTGEAPLGSPFAQFLGGQIYSAEGDVIGTFDFDEPTQSIVADFESATATINAEDGILGVFFVELDPGLSPGAKFDLVLNGGDTFLNDPEEDPITIDIRNGELTVRAASAPLAFEVDGDKIHPGSGALVEIGTAEPFDIQSGRIVLQYDPAIAWGLPAVTTDARHGIADLTVTYPASGRVQIDFVSPASDFNSVPGSLLVVQIPTLPGVPLGTMSPVSVDAAESYIDGPGSLPLSVSWASDVIEFESHPAVFADGFETGDPWVWSRFVSP
ncbi:MAG: hypothetical protein R2862_08845 [Thermoanaerobaculia bacterium]